MKADDKEAFPHFFSREISFGPEAEQTTEIDDVYKDLALNSRGISEVDDYGNKEDLMSFYKYFTSRVKNEFKDDTIPTSSKFLIYERLGLFSMLMGEIGKAIFWLEKGEKTFDKLPQHEKEKEEIRKTYIQLCNILGNLLIGFRCPGKNVKNNKLKALKYLHKAKKLLDDFDYHENEELQKWLDGRKAWNEMNLAQALLKERNRKASISKIRELLNSALKKVLETNEKRILKEFLERMKNFQMKIDDEDELFGKLYGLQEEVHLEKLQLKSELLGIFSHTQESEKEEESTTLNPVLQRDDEIPSVYRGYNLNDSSASLNPWT